MSYQFVKFGPLLFLVEEFYYREFYRYAPHALISVNSL